MRPSLFSTSCYPVIALAALLSQPASATEESQEAEPAAPAATTVAAADSDVIVVTAIDACEMQNRTGSGKRRGHCRRCGK